jgi:hypothetical protein
MNYVEDMKTDDIVVCLLKDMEMLRDGEWEPDNDSIEAHCELITELQRRIA